ncbi:MAG TPA: hypothetical protein VMU87_01335 [Stellaceae bacterium]|nr:hypothetical protein [Stellaceae bacterium]
MLATILSFFGLLTQHLPDVIASGETMWNDIAHGEGGIVKVEKAASDLATIAAQAAGVAATARASVTAQNGGTAPVTAQPAGAP